ncbi:MAG TPA: S41 family peptidase [Bryobacteraceae bacterium]|nr:S41 family peptidase [Bryobacteraceae bacterium]
MNHRARFAVVLSSTVIVGLLLFGSVASKGASGDGSDNADVLRHLKVYTQVLSYISTEYVEEPNIPNVTLGALNGLLEAIDPYASYLNATQYKDYLKNSDGHPGDLGLILAKKVGYLVVVAAVPGSPADKAGLVDGDYIESINGVGSRDMPLAYAKILLRGDVGTTVNLSVLRRKPEPTKMTITRAIVTAPPVEWRMLDGSLGYVKAPTLGTGKIREVANAVEDLQKQGAKKLILDVRNCAVGDAEDGASLANLFVSKGLLTYDQGQKVPRKDYNADPKDAISTLPLVVLTNRATASGCEVGAAALQGNKRAALVGERTYGDASILRPITMDDGSAVILSVAKFYTPDGKSIQDNGVTPETAVLDPDLGTGDPEEEDATPTPAAPKKASDDIMLKKAIEVAGTRS